MKRIAVVLLALVMGACGGESVDGLDQLETSDHLTVTIQADIGELSKQATPLSVGNAINHKGSFGGLDLFYLRQEANQSLKLEISDNIVDRLHSYNVSINIFNSKDIDLRSAQNTLTTGRNNAPTPNISLLGAIQVPAGSQSTELGIVVSDNIFTDVDPDSPEFTLKKSRSTLYFSPQSSARDFYLAISLNSNSQIAETDLTVNLSEQGLNLRSDFAYSQDDFINNRTLTLDLGSEPIVIEVENLREFTLAPLKYGAAFDIFDIDGNVLNIADYATITVFQSLSDVVFKEETVLADEFNAVGNIIPGSSEVFYLRVDPISDEAQIINFIAFLDAETFQSQPMEFFQSFDDLLFEELNYLLLGPRLGDYTIDIYSPWHINNGADFVSDISINEQGGREFTATSGSLPFSAQFTVQTPNLPLLLTLNSRQAVADFGLPEDNNLEFWPNFFWGIRALNPVLDISELGDEYSTFLFPGEAARPIEFRPPAEFSGIYFSVTPGAIEMTEEDTLDFPVAGSITLSVRDTAGELITQSSFDIDDFLIEIELLDGLDYDAGQSYFLTVEFDAADGGRDYVFDYDLFVGTF